MNHSVRSCIQVKDDEDVDVDDDDVVSGFVSNLIEHKKEVFPENFFSCNITICHLLEDMKQLIP